MTDPSDIQSLPPTTPNTSSQPPTPKSQPRPTMHFEAAVLPPTMEEKMSAIGTQMSSITTLFESMKTDQEETLEKYKQTRVETIDAKVADVVSDIQHHDLDIDVFDAFKDDSIPKVDQALAHPTSSHASPDDRNDFPRFSGYMGTRTTLQKPVPADEYYKFVLPASASSTSSYVDPSIPLPAGTYATATNDNPNEHGLFALASNLTVNIGKFQKRMQYLQLGGDDVLSIRDFIMAFGWV
eukprot:scaffold252323_cov38-Attheya_sp.AAC.1